MPAPSDSNISGDATTPSGNIFSEAMRGIIVGCIDYGFSWVDERGQTGFKLELQKLIHPEREKHFRQCKLTSICQLTAWLLCIFLLVTATLTRTYLKFIELMEGGSYNCMHGSIERRAVGTDSEIFSRGEHPRRSPRTKAGTDARRARCWKRCCGS